MRRIIYNNLSLLVIFTLVIHIFAVPFNKNKAIRKVRARILNGKSASANFPTIIPVPSPTPVQTQVSIAQTASTPIPKNGIYVTPVKVFDDRAMAQNLQQIEANLANLRFFDQNSLSSAIGTLQGARMDSSSLSASVTMQASPSLETATTTDTAATGAITQKVVETEKQGSNVPSAPSVVQPTSTFVPPSAFRISAQDLLAEQMSMTYQIINMRTFLQRSLSDRRLDGRYTKNTKDSSDKVTSTPETFSGARAIAVLGFRVSVNNPEQYKDAVAEVQIEIANKITKGKNKDGSEFTAVYDQPPSLIMQSPVEKTYNVATITKDAKSFSLGAAVQVLNIGFSSEKKSETLYLVRDNDTVAFSDAPFTGSEFGNGDCKDVSDQAISFGWQFRPVLGRRSVEPGPRQVMAMIALPNASNLPYTATIRVKTRWVKFDKKRKVVGGEIGNVVSQCLQDLEIPSMQETRESLSPKLDPSWTDIGSGLAEVALEGENFLPGTNVVVGDTIYNQLTPGFRQNGESEIRFVVPIQKLAQFSDIHIASDYGGLQPIQNSRITEIPPAGFEPTKMAGWGAKISGVTAESDDGQKVKLTIKMLPLITGSRPILNNAIHHSVVTIGDQVYDTRKVKVIDDPADANAKLITLNVPLPLADSAGSLSVKDFFWGTDYASSYPVDLSKTFMVNKVEVLATNDKATWLAIRGNNFIVNTTKIIVGEKEYPTQNATNYKFRSPSLIELKIDVPESQLKNIKQLTVTNGTVFLPVQVSSPVPKLTIQVDKAGVVAEGEVKDIKIEGVNLNNVSYVLFINDRIPFNASGDGKSASLSVTRDLSRTRGNQQLNFVLKDGTVIPYLLKISSP